MFKPRDRLRRRRLQNPRSTSGSTAYSRFLSTQTTSAQSLRRAVPPPAKVALVPRILRPKRSSTRSAAARSLRPALRHLALACAASSRWSLFLALSRDCRGVLCDSDIAYNRQDNRWERSGRMTAVLPHNSYHVSLDGSRRVTKRMRAFKTNFYLSHPCRRWTLHAGADQQH